MKPSSTPLRTAPRRQRGVVLLLALIILVVLLGAAAALVRSFDTSLFVAGNLAFKRDLVNQGERVVPTILNLMQTGALNTAALRGSTNAAINYSATVLPSNAQGIPTALLQTTAGFDAATNTQGVVFARSANDVAVAGQGVSIRYVIDRQCVATGDEATIIDQCTTSTVPPPPAGSTSQLNRAEFAVGGVASAVPQQVVYRLSLRVDGPRDTQAFLQTTLTR